MCYYLLDYFQTCCLIIIIFFYEYLILGTLFSVTVLSKGLKISDAIIGFTACIFDIFAAICYVFVNEPWQLSISKYQ